ncbi:MAG: hypothetical protein N3A38_05420 [Planctomycetota bacterium]|nr:hypothetical protein [Planctomycetota bacterium]
MIAPGRLERRVFHRAGRIRPGVGVRKPEFAAPARLAFAAGGLGVRGRGCGCLNLRGLAAGALNALRIGG